jgi:hypothetical protein
VSVGVKREDRVIRTSRTDLAAAVFGTERFPGILDYSDAAMSPDLEYWIEVGGIACPVKQNHRFRAGSYFPGNLVRIDVAGHWIDVAPHDIREQIAYRAAGGQTDQRREEDIVARANARMKQAHCQSARNVPASRRPGIADVTSQGAFEARDVRPAGNLAGSQNFLQ